MKSTPEQIRAKTIETLRKILPPGNSPTTLTCGQLAKALHVQPQTIRRGLCVDGMYLGLVPEKLANGRLFFIISD